LFNALATAQLPTVATGCSKANALCLNQYNLSSSLRQMQGRGQPRKPSAYHTDIRADVSLK
jgi:hypothetical protein